MDTVSPPVSPAPPPAGSESVWMTEIVLGIFLIILANFALKRLLKYFQRFSFSQHWKERIDHIFYLPLHVALWIFGVGYVLDILGGRFGFAALLKYLTPLRNAGIICCLGWLLIRWKTEAQHAILAKKLQRGRSIDAGAAHVLGRLLSVVIVVITLLIVLQVIGLNVAPLIAFGGIGAAALGFAGKDVIANCFGGVMLSLTRPFTIGDLILLPDRNLEGHVEEIGWYLTSVRDKEKRPVYLPNSIFSTLLVINCSRMSHRKIEEKLGVRYGDFSKVKAITEEIRSALSSHPSIDTNLPVLVFFHSFHEYSLEIHIEAYCLETRYEEFLAVKQEILLKVHQIITSQGAEMPFPTSVVALLQEK